MHGLSGIDADDSVLNPLPSLGRVKQYHHEPIFSFDRTLPTALANFTIDSHVSKVNITAPFPSPHRSQIITTLIVNHRPVFFADIIGLNGAVHVIEELLDPRGHNSQYSPLRDHSADKNTWEDWEDWLLDWAAAN